MTGVTAIGIVARALLVYVSRPGGRATLPAAFPCRVADDFACSNPRSRMLDRLATRALFWSALAALAGVGGLLSVGALPWLSALLERATSVQFPLVDYLPTFGNAAPFLSLLSFTIAIAGWRRLHQELERRASAELSAQLHASQLHEAMQAMADGVFLLRAIHGDDGMVSDLEIVDVNASGARLLRNRHDTLVGCHLRRDLASVGQVLTPRYLEAIATRKTVSEELRVSRRLFGGGWLHHQAVPTGDGIAVTVRDISSRKREERRLRRASLTDELTQLYNRRGFLSLGERQLGLARRQERDAVLLYIDMDDFKTLNDLHGHAEGDRALVAVGRLLRRVVRDCDLVGRFGGDEFTILAFDADRAAARSIQRRIEERLALMNAAGECAMPVSLTIGHTRVRPSEHAPLIELLHRADALLYARKRRRKLTGASAARSANRLGLATSSEPGRQAPARAPALVVPPDVAAIARATAVGAASRAAAVPPGAGFGSRRLT